MSEAAFQMRPHVVQQRLRDGTPGYLVDVRSPTEFGDGHALGALSMPLEQLDRTELSAALGAAAGREIPVSLIGSSGARAIKAAEKLRAQGLTNLIVVEGGTEAWKAQGLPLRHNSTLPSLARQTQIAIGVILLLSLVKGFMLHPVFYILIGLLSAGLVSAGFTGSCALAALLTRMPWNRSATEKTAWST